MNQLGCECCLLETIYARVLGKLLLNYFFIFIQLVVV